MGLLVGKLRLLLSLWPTTGQFPGQNQQLQLGLANPYVHLHDLQDKGYNLHLQSQETGQRFQVIDPDTKGIFWRVGAHQILYSQSGNQHRQHSEGQPGIGVLERNRFVQLVLLDSETIKKGGNRNEGM